VIDLMLEQFRQLGYPEIEPVPDGENRPAWSVMIPTYNCAEYLRETLRSVLLQDPGPERMQIEVIDDASTKDEPEAVVRELGGGRVAFYRQPQNVGATANFNTCLARSRGHLVHILHGDDLVLPPFYDFMKGLLDRNPAAGLATCRYVFMDVDGLWTKLGELRQRVAGIDQSALPSIAVANWARFPAVVLRRSLVEDIGGFHPTLIHAADWDLWKRAALYQPLAYEPTALACYRRFEGNDSSRLIKTGANVADFHRAIDLGDQYLPQPESATWSQRAIAGISYFAKETAVGMLRGGDFQGFRHQVRELSLLDPKFRLSRGNIGLHLLCMMERLKWTLSEAKTWISRHHSLRTATGSEVTMN
jgi:GT2 family glycosyltransferase